jgi:hypothetical protein
MALDNAKDKQNTEFNIFQLYNCEPERESGIWRKCEGHSQSLEARSDGSGQQYHTNSPAFDGMEFAFQHESPGWSKIGKQNQPRPKGLFFAFATFTTFSLVTVEIYPVLKVLNPYIDTPFMLAYIPYMDPKGVMNPWLHGFVPACSTAPSLVWTSGPPKWVDPGPGPWGQPQRPWAFHGVSMESF